MRSKPLAPTGTCGDPLTETNRSVLYPVVGNRPKQERSQRTRAHIIQTAASAFAEHGFDGVSLNGLVTASGLSKGAFYFHFSSKEEIALAAFRAKQQEMLTLLAAQKAPTKAADRLVLGLRKRAQLVQEDPSFGCITRLGSQFNERSTPGSVYASFLDAARGAIAELVADGQGRGEFRIDLDPEAAARTIFAAVVGVDTLSHLSSRGKDFEDRIDELIDVLLNGLLKPSGGSKRRGSGRRAASDPGGRITSSGIRSHEGEKT